MSIEVPASTSDQWLTPALPFPTLQTYLATVKKSYGSWVIDDIYVHQVTTDNKLEIIYWGNGTSNNCVAYINYVGRWK